LQINLDSIVRSDRAHNRIKELLHLRERLTIRFCEHVRAGELLGHCVLNVLLKQVELLVGQLDFAKGKERLFCFLEFGLFHIHGDVR